MECVSLKEEGFPRWKGLFGKVCSVLFFSLGSWCASLSSENAAAFMFFYYFFFFSGVITIPFIHDAEIYQRTEANSQSD